MKDSDLQRRLDLLIRAVSDMEPPLLALMWRSFLRGLFSALGATVGVSIILALVTFLLQQLGLFPGLAPFLKTVGPDMYFRR